MRRILSCLVLSAAALGLAGCHTCDVCDDCGDGMCGSRKCNHCGSGVVVQPAEPSAPAKLSPAPKAPVHSSDAPATTK